MFCTPRLPFEFARACFLAGFVVVSAGLSGCQITADKSVPATELAEPNSLSEDLAPIILVNNGKSQLNPQWQGYKVLPHKRLTKYEAIQIDGQFALRADADRSASVLQTGISIDPEKKPFLSFSWRADEFAADADVSDRNLEDSPVRIIVAFDGDHASLEPKDRAVLEQAQFFTGRKMPYATLMYVWSNTQALEAVVINPHSRRVRKIVLSNKSTPRGKWQMFKRNIVADYERAYGVKPKGKIKAIAIMSDSDNTGDPALGYYRDIVLTAK